MQVDLSKYETVKERKKRFKADFPDGRIVVENKSVDIMEHALIYATLYKNADEQREGLALSTGYAMEVRDKEKKVSNSGKEYESVNFSSWVENCEESAIGRALDNAGYAGNDKCSREEMEKAQRMSTTLGYANDTKKPVKTALSAVEFIKKVDECVNEDVYRSLWSAANHQRFDKAETAMVKEAFDRALKRIREVKHESATQS